MTEDEVVAPGDGEEETNPTPIEEDQPEVAGELSNTPETTDPNANAPEEPNESAPGAAEGSEEDSDDDDEDGIQITIDREKIDEAKSTFQTFGGVSKNVRLPPGEKKGKFTVEEFDQVGAINGQAPHEFDIESVEEKPWKKPGKYHR